LRALLLTNTHRQLALKQHAFQTAVLLLAKKMPVRHKLCFIHVITNVVINRFVMKLKIIKGAILAAVGCLSLGLNTAALANWYEATGQAAIERGDLNSARRAAIEDALQRASLFAGARLQSQQQVIQGIMQHNKHFLSGDFLIRCKEVVAHTVDDPQTFRCQQVIGVVRAAGISEVPDMVEFTLILCVDPVGVHQ
jgi:hypothetical protein